MTATGTTVPVITASGAVSFEALTAEGLYTPIGAAEFLALSAAGYARAGSLGAVTFEAMRVDSRGGVVAFERLVAFGQASETALETYDAKVMNTRSGAVTEFTNYKFNSFARIGKDYYGVGPSGLFRLDGATDNGADINWSMRTGRHDDKHPGMKRVPNVYLGLRSNGFVTVRVWSDDVTYHDYPLPKVQTNTIHQHRVVPGKGLLSRYFGVELRGTKNATLELDSMQIDMKKLDTRLG
jgi:hypothetical protein